MITAELSPEDVLDGHVVRRRRNIGGIEHPDRASVSTQMHQSLEHLAALQEQPDNGLRGPGMAEEVEQCLGRMHRLAVIVLGDVVTHPVRLRAQDAD